MICTVKDLLIKNNIGKRETLYFQESELYFNYPMSMGDFFEYTSALNKDNEFEMSAWIAEEMEKAKDSSDYVALMIAKCQLQQKMHATQERTELHKYRMQIKEVAEQIRAAEGEYTDEAILSYHRKNNIAGHKVLEYKHHLLLNSLQNMRRSLTGLKAKHLDWLQELPIFTENIYGLRGIHKDKLAIEGGPCLFGTDEVDTIVHMETGEQFVFDCNSGVCIHGECNLRQADFFKEEGNKITAICFECRKDGFSSQEIELFEALFGIASAMQCRLMISLPDMSYKKYFSEITKELSESVRELALQNYTEVLYRIVDLYLLAIKRYRERYSVEQLEVLHERNQTLYEMFLNEREKYCSIENVTTNQEDKRSSIYDYICLPAMPYYLWRAPNVIEINSTDEVDSVRKCFKHHKKVLKIHQIMLPEKVSDDGIHTVFRAQRKHKGYRKLYEL